MRVAAEQFAQPMRQIQTDRITLNLNALLINSCCRMHYFVYHYGARCVILLNSVSQFSFLMPFEACNAKKMVSP